MEFFLKNKIVILRSIGAIMLVVGFAVHFWVTPKEGLSANEKAAARVARMEAKVQGKSSSTSTSKKSTKKDSSKFLEKMQETQAKQIQYMTILAMLLGVLSLGYSFIPKQED